MRFVLILLAACGTAVAQQPPGLAAFLVLTPAQVASVTQLNATYNSYVRTKSIRENVVQAELNAEYAKPSPSALALGQRYIEIDAIDHDTAAAAANLNAAINALLTPAQMALLQQIASAAALQSLNYDASCGYLEPLISAPTFAFRSGDFSSAYVSVSGVTYASFLLGYPIISTCSSSYPISIRNYLALTDSQVSAILSLEDAYKTLQTRKTNRMNDVNVEIRDETAKPQPDPLALGVRYAELVEISQELRQADLDGRASARNLLTPAQQAKLKSLMDQTAPTTYQFAAASCHFISLPNFGTTQCQLN